MKNLKQNKTYEIHSFVFGLMVLSSAGLYFAAGAGSEIWIWGLIGLFVSGNVLVMLVK